MTARAVETGERVVLCRPRALDGPEFLAFVARNRRYHQPWVQPPRDADAFADYCRRVRAPRHRGFLVRTRAAGELVGVVNLNEIVLGALRSAYIGFYGSRDHGGRGFMTEGVGLALRHAFRTLRLHRVEANVQPENRRSLGVVERCGFVHEGFSPRYLKVAGRWRDHERWAIRSDARRSRM